MNFCHLSKDCLVDKGSLGALSGKVNILMTSLVDRYSQLSVCISQ